MKNNLERKLMEEVDSSMGGQLKAKGIYPKLVVDNTSMANKDTKQEDKATQKRLLEQAEKKLEKDEKRARKEIAEAISARGVFIENINNIESLLEKSGPKGNKRLEALLSQAKDHLHLIDNIFPHESSSAEYDENVFNTIVAKFKDYEHARRAETIATIKNNEGKGPLGDVIREQNVARALHEEISALTKQGEQIIENKKPHPAQDESIGNIRLAQEISKPDRGIFEQKKANAQMQSEMDTLVKSTVENGPTTQTRLEIVPEMHPLALETTLPHENATQDKKESIETTPKNTTHEQKSGLSRGAIAMLENADKYGVHSFVSDHMRHTAEANGIKVSKHDTPQNIIDKLRLKIDQGIAIKKLPEQTHHTKKHHEHKQENKNMKFEQPTVETATENKQKKDDAETLISHGTQDSVVAQAIIAKQKQITEEVQREAVAHHKENKDGSLDFEVAPVLESEASKISESPVGTPLQNQEGAFGILESKIAKQGQTELHANQTNAFNQLFTGKIQVNEEISTEAPVAEISPEQNASFAEAVSDFKFSPDVKQKLDPVQLELFEKIEKGIVVTENNIAIREKKADLPEGLLNRMRFAGKEYAKLPLKTKLLVSVALLGVAWVAGGTLASVAIGGSVIQRGLGGLATFVAAEGAMKASAEKGGRERGEWEARRHTSVALLAGFLVGGGVLGHAIQNVLNETPTSKSIGAQPHLPDELVETSSGPLEAELAQGKANFAALEHLDATNVPVEGGASAEAINLNQFIKIAEPGDSRWSLAERALSEGPYKDLFNALPSDEQRTYLIDAVKNKITEGMTDAQANTLNVGDKIDFQEIFINKDFIDSEFKTAEGLSSEQMANIENYKAPTEIALQEAHGNEIVSPLGTEETPSQTMTKEDVETYYKGAPEVSPYDPHTITQVEAYADNILDQDIDRLLGSKGFLGFGHTSGLDSISWKDPEVGFGGKTVSEVLNAHPSAFPEDGAKHFGVEDYTATTKMQSYINNVRRVAGISPDVNEKVADFIRRAAMVTSKLPR